MVIRQKSHVHVTVFDRFRALHNVNVVKNIMLCQHNSFGEAACAGGKQQDGDIVRVDREIRISLVTRFKCRAAFFQKFGNVRKPVELRHADIFSNESFFLFQTVCKISVRFVEDKDFGIDVFK